MVIFHSCHQSLSLYVRLTDNLVLYANIRSIRNGRLKTTMLKKAAERILQNPLVFRLISPCYILGIYICVFTT